MGTTLATPISGLNAGALCAQWSFPPWIEVASDALLCLAFLLLLGLIASVAIRRKQLRIAPVWWVIASFLIAASAAHLLGAFGDIL
ncbi:MAG: hypothetical protein WEH44_09820, partial [Pirellulaceae bacterium]